jgi:hypothetical protein
MTEEQEEEEMNVLRLHINSIVAGRQYTLYVEKSDGAGYYAVTTLRNLAELKKFLEANLESMNRDDTEELFPP